MKSLNLHFTFLIVLTFFSCSYEESNIEDYENQKFQESKNRNIESLTIVSYNIFHLPGIARIKHYKEEERSTKQLQVLTEMAPLLDVIVFQEGFNRQAETYLFNKLEEVYPYNTVLVGQYCSAGSYWNSVNGDCSNSLFVVNGGVRIFSKYPIDIKRQYVFNNSAYGTADYYSNKGAVYVEITKNGKKYHIVGTHLQADQGSYNGTSVRLKQLKEIRDWVNSLKIPISEPLIYAGDMNVEYTDTFSYKDMKSILNSRISYSFNPSTEAGTYSNTNTLVRKEYPNYNNTLDYILISKSHKQPVFIPEMQVLQFVKDGEDLSDHNAVKTTYSFNN
ncbi:sphingomyelin phosphodiesterase [Aquimarina sp. Aq78]|uniref:sphingomyelin phosphodiesterase n=1 Tax=Aquimarina sp. Aq78 TaxID=1191889 RepID=UPI000D10F066|nr:sphingomyelin phosphodiesterase [Aquimarina sp. Aq78]